MKLRGSFRVNAGPQGLTLRIEGERETFVALLRLAFQVMKAPKLPQDAFERAQRDGVRALRDSRNEPQTLRQEAVRAHYNQARARRPRPPGVLAQPGRPHRLDAGRSAGAGACLPREMVERQRGRGGFRRPLARGLAQVLDEELAAWKKPGLPAHQRHVSRHQPVPPAAFHAQASDKASAVLRLRQQVQLDSEHPDTVALALANHVLGGASMANRLSQKLRVDGGLTYGISSDFSTANEGDAAAWTLDTSIAPENRDKALAIIQATVRDLLRDGVTEAELGAARNALLQSRRQQRASDAALPGRMNALAQRGLDWTYTEAWDQRYRDTTLEQVNAALRRHLNPDAWVISTAGDYAKKPPLAP